MTRMSHAGVFQTEMREPFKKISGVWKVEYDLALCGAGPDLMASRFIGGFGL